MKMITCFFLLLFTAGCVTTPIDEQLETNKADNADLWPYMDWRTNGGEEIRYREHLETTTRPSGTVNDCGDGWFLDDIKLQLQDIQ